MSILDMASLVLIAVGCLFFIAGSVGMLRLPDVFTRLHATTKADNVGLGLLVLGLLLRSGSMFVASKLVLIWLLVLVAGATTCHLIAQSAVRRGERPWSKR
ncbi:monovalent cation/H(+) antiporter subunit G [Novipirellula caenicola]|uniref:Na(+)/H(+) antiporter subunit G1 n=1 Tax=Novipirellula caenicola TaxID=1536901 RepID=A0ABP9VTP4_9BACT